MNIIETHIVTQVPDNVRLSDYCVGVFASLPSRKGVKKAIERGEILINGRRGFCGDWVHSGDELHRVESLVQQHIPEIELDIPVVYEDDYFAVVNKPAGIEVSGNKLWTLQNGLSKLIAKSSLPDALPVPRPVHRLDYGTSGLVIVAKTISTAAILGKQLEQHTIRKRYRAIVIGAIDGSGFIEIPLDGKTAKSEYQRVCTVASIKNKTLSLVDLYPHTGRTHQLRKHMVGIGYPILGDALYGTEGMILKGKGMFLAAVSLEMDHPYTGISMHIEIPQPHKFDLLLQREATMFEKRNRIKI